MKVFLFFFSFLPSLSVSCWCVSVSAFSLPLHIPPPFFFLVFMCSPLSSCFSLDLGGWLGVVGSHLTSCLLKQSENGTPVNMQIGLLAACVADTCTCCISPPPHLPVSASDLQQIAVVSSDRRPSVLEREMGVGGRWRLERVCCGAGREEIMTRLL